MTDDAGGNGHGAGGTPAMRFRSQPNGRPALEVEVPVSKGDSTSSPASASTSAANPAAIDWEVPVASWSVGPDRSSPSEPEDPAPSELEAPAAITPVSAVTPLSARRTGPPKYAPTPKPVPASTGQAGASPRTSGPVIRHPRAGHRRRRIAVTVAAGVIVGLGSASFALHGGNSVSNSSADPTSTSPAGAGGSHSSTSGSAGFVRFRFRRSRWNRLDDGL